MVKDYHIFRDPIHGFIKVNDFEMEIINSKPFQRLRYIKQLALTNLVYHGADHTRFAHSLGMMEFATRIFDILMLKHGDMLRRSFGWNDDLIKRNRQLLRISCLVHDIGHAPFSHGSEILFPNGMRHEDYSEKIATLSPIKEITDDKGRDYGIDSTMVRELITGEPLADTAFLKEIIRGDLDADRMDYLLRDSYYTGVYYGKFDHERLIHTFTLKEAEMGGAPVLAIDEGGKHAAEALILARYFMFTQVYFHKVRRIYDLHLTDLIKEALNDGTFPSKIEEYLEWDDLKVFGIMKEKAREGNDVANRILTRNHYECVFETSEHSGPEEIDRFHRMLSALREEYPGEDIKEDRSDKVPHLFRKERFFLKMRTGDMDYAQIDDKSDIIKGLKPIFQRRLYVSESLFKEVSEFCIQYTERHRLEHD